MKAEDMAAWDWRDLEAVKRLKYRYMRLPGSERLGGPAQLLHGRRAGALQRGGLCGGRPRRHH